MDKKTIQQALKKYESLKKDKEYQRHYRAYKSLKECIEEGNVDDDIRYLYGCFHQIICERWGLKYPVSPPLSINKDKIFDMPVTNRMASGKIIYATGMSNDVALAPDMKFEKIDIEAELGGQFIKNYFTEFSSRKKDKRIKNHKRSGIEKEHWKYIVYFLSTQLKMSRRVLSRMFDIHHNTVAKIVEEVSTWSELDRNIIVDEIQTGKYYTGSTKNRTRTVGDSSYLDHLAHQKSLKQ